MVARFAGFLGTAFPAEQAQQGLDSPPLVGVLGPEQDHGVHGPQDGQEEGSVKPKESADQLGFGTAAAPGEGLHPQARRGADEGRGLDHAAVRGIPELVGVAPGQQHQVALGKVPFADPGHVELASPGRHHVERGLVGIGLEG